jgi:hypothetical protein
MLELRPMVIDNNNVVLGGNMRLTALKDLGYKEIPDNWVKRASELTDEEKQRFVIADNVGFGDWDWDILANTFDSELLLDWGLDLPIEKDYKEQDLFDIEIPIYKPNSYIPNINELANIEKTKNLNIKIDKLNIENELKEILKIRASFFTDFNFDKIADYYYNAENELKEIFENLGLVILTPEKALKNGFIELSENVFEL